MDFTNHDIPADHFDNLRHRLSGWSIRIRASGLDGLVSALMDAAEPLSPLGAQMLWVAQPTLKLFMPAGEIDGLAKLLDDPAGVMWLREILTEPDDRADADKIVMNVLVYAVILFALVMTIVGTVLSRRVQLRELKAYSDMPLRVDEAIESNTAVHVSLGSSAVRDDSTLTAIAGAELLYHLAERAALADKPTIVTLSDPVTLSLAQDTLRKAYKARGAASKYHATLARWFPQGPHSLAFGAGAGLTTLDENASANFLIGRFGLELMLAAESAIRNDRTLIAQSDRVDGQAVAFVVSDAPLIGEELYAGAAYLDPKRLHVGGVVAQDVLRYALVLLVIGLAILSFLGAKF